jgi:hypothetical protein
MTDELNGNIILRLLIQCFVLAWLAVVGLMVSLSDIACGNRVFIAFIGMSSGATLFLKVACAQIARYYRDEFDSRASSLGT